MNVEVKKITESKFDVNVTVDREKWVEAQSKERKKALSKVSIKGFRKGHVPENIAIKYVNEGEVLNSAINAILPEAYDECFLKSELKPITRPVINVDKVTKDDLVIRFTVLVTPKVTLGEYKGLYIKKEKVEVKEEDIDKDIKALLAKNAELVVKDGEAKIGDTVVIDFEGYVDGAKFDGGSSKNYELKLGSNQFVPGFEDQLVGSKAGDSKEVKVKFPEQYVENLKGKDATFKCKVNEVKEEVIPELNDENVKDLAIEGVDNVAKLKENRKAVLLENKEKEVKNNFYTKLLEKIMESSSVEIDDLLIDNETAAMKEDLVNRIESNGLKYDQYLQIINKKEEDILNEMKETAKKNLKSTFVLNSIIAQEKVTVSDEDVETKMKKIAEQYKMDLAKVKDAFSKNIENLKNQIIYEKLEDLLISLN